MSERERQTDRQTKKISKKPNIFVIKTTDVWCQIAKVHVEMSSVNIKSLVM